MKKIELLNKLWRPMGAWGLVVNLTFLPPAIFFMAWAGKGNGHIPAMIGMVATLGGWFVGMAAVRQNQKNTKIEAETEIKIAEINDDDHLDINT